MKLYQLPSAFAEIEAMLTDGEIDTQAMEKLASLEGELQEKVQSCLCVARNFAARAEARKNEANRLAALAQADASNEKRLKEYVQGVMTQLGQDRIETELFKVWIQNNPPSVNVDDVSTLPTEFTKTTVEADKKALMAAHKEGKTLPGGVTINQTRSLRVK